MYLGINLGHHDSSVCVLFPYDQKFKAVIYEEERLSKLKHAGLYPYRALYEVEQVYGIKSFLPSNITFTNFLLNLPETWQHIKENPTKFTGVLNFDERVSEQNREAQHIIHHECHLFSILPGLDPAQEYLIVIADGCGAKRDEILSAALFVPKTPLAEGNLFESISIYRYQNCQVTCLEKILSPLHMWLGTLQNLTPATYFTAASQVIFGDWPYAGKVMGLAAYHQGELFSDEKMFQLLGIENFNKNSSKNYFDNEISSEHWKFCIKLAATVQNYLERYSTQLFTRLRTQYGLKNLVYAGGVALNCIFNEKLRRSQLFDSITIPAWTNDEGVALGAAVGGYFKQHGKLPVLENPASPFLGHPRSPSESQIRVAFKDYEVSPLTVAEAANLIAQNHIIALVEGASETGPRALGHRSILCLPTIPGIREYLNDKIKFRERFRPYGCSVLEEDQELYFEDAKGLMSPYMSFAPVVKSSMRGYVKEIIHRDQTIRIQTVTPLFGFLHDLLKCLKAQTGHSLIIHTSLNINKQPILETLEDAVKFMRQSELQYMVIENMLVKKKKAG